MTEENSPQVEPSQPKLGPGDRLQSARISNGLTLEDVAKKMHLSASIVSSLEENSFDDITAPIFVKGYLRAYSRIVNISEDDIIQQYSTYYMEGDPPISTTSNTTADLNADGSRVKLITYIIIIGLIVLLASWWWNRYQQSPETLSLDSGNLTTNQIELAQSDSVETDADTSLDKATATETVADSARESLQPEITSITEAIKVDIKQPEADEVDLSEVNTNVVSPTPETVPTAEPEERTIEQDVVEQDADEEVAPQQEKNLLVITVNADTWASIKDATGKKLVYDLLHSGEQVTVTGIAPIQAFLGNGYGVTMTYQGKDIDLSRVIRPDNTARIKIGQ